jgi:VanZ family protein
MSSLPSRGACAWSALLYAALMLYASTIVGPAGFYYVPGDPAENLHRLIGIVSSGFVANGSDQRADWMGNVVMTIPLGGMLMLALRGRVAGGLFAFVVGAIWVLLVKYVQLHFTRTVTLNYIAAQSLGLLAGICATGISRGWLIRLFDAIRKPDRDALLALALAASAMALMLVWSPYDIALSGSDLAERVGALSQSLLAFPNAGRAVWLRLALLALGGAAFAPVGMAATLQLSRDGARAGWADILAISLAVVMLSWLGSLLILSATPSIFTPPARVAGALAGAWAVREITPAHLAWLRRALGWKIWQPVYLLLFLAANDLLTRQFRSPEAAWEAAYPSLFLPLWTFYIVSKAQAMKSLAVHALMYAPVGVLLSAGLGERQATRGRIAAAALIAILLAAIGEVGRAMRPGLTPDPNNLAIAAIAAPLALLLMPRLWAMLDSVAREPRR